MKKRNWILGGAVIAAAGVLTYYAIINKTKTNPSINNVEENKLENIIQHDTIRKDTLNISNVEYASDMNQLRMLWTHVYNPKRLVVNDSLITVTGTIITKRREPDGDSHINLLLDKGYEYLLNSHNIERQKGCLVCEPVCVYKATQKDAIDAVNGYTNDIKIPKVGTHVKMTGSYILDKQHGWMEIHPVLSIEEIN